MKEIDKKTSEISTLEWPEAVKYLEDKGVTWLKGIVFKGDVSVTGPRVTTPEGTTILVVNRVLSSNLDTGATYFGEDGPIAIDADAINAVIDTDLFIIASSYKEVTIEGQDQGLYLVRDIVNQKNIQDKSVKRKRFTSEEVAQMRKNLTGEGNTGMGKKRPMFIKRENKLKVKGTKFIKKGRTRSF